MKTQFQTGPFLILSYRTWILFLFEIVEKPASGIAEGSISGVLGPSPGLLSRRLRRPGAASPLRAEALYRASVQAGRAFSRLRAHWLGALRAVRPHVFQLRSGCRSPCGRARGTACLGVHGLGG